MVTTKREYEPGLPDSESSIRFAIGSTVPPFWMFPGRHFAHSDRNGLVRLVNIANGSVGTVAGQLSSRPITDDTLSYYLFVLDVYSI